MSHEKERLLARKAKLEARLAAIADAESKKQQKLDQRRADLAGRAVLKHARKDEAFAAQLRRILDAEITGARNRDLFDLPPKDHGRANGAEGETADSGTTTGGETPASKATASAPPSSAS